LKHRFVEFAQVAFWARQKSENYCAGPGEPWKHHFLDLEKVAFWFGQKSANDFEGQATLKS
jgi:hypothetical protein